MSLARRITAEDFAKKSKDIQSEYTKDGDGYILDLDGYEDPDELRRARDRERQTAKELRKQLKEAREQLEALDLEPDEDDPSSLIPRKERDKKADIAKLEKSWKDKHEKVTGELSAKLAAHQKNIQQTLISGTAEKLAHKISTTPKVFAPYVANRLKVEFGDDDLPVLHVLDKDGKPGLTIEQLEKELLTDKDLAHSLVGSKASGGGAPRNGTDQKLGSGAVASDGKPVDLSKMPAKDLAGLLKTTRQEA